jgi:hypothetical protein
MKRRKHFHVPEANAVSGYGKTAGISGLLEYG